MLQDSISRLLGLGAAVILLLILALAAFTTHRMLQIRHQTQELATLYARNALLLTDFETKILLMGVLKRDLLFTPDPAARADLLAQIRHTRRSLISAVETMAADNSEWHELIQLAESYLGIHQQVQAALEQEELHLQAERLMAEHLTPTRQRLIELLDEFENVNIQAWAQATEETEQLVQGFFVGSLLTYGVILGLASLVLTGLHQRVGRQARELQEKTQTLEIFASSAAHDLRTPLTAISGFANLIRKRHGQQLPREADLHLERIVANVAKMDAMIRDLLLLARAGQVVEEPRPVDMSSLLHEIREDLRPQLQQTGGSILWSTDLPKAKGDPARIRQIFQNLLENAIKFRREGMPPQVHITGHSLDGWTEYRVEDNGLGIPQEFHQRIFEPYFRVAQSRTVAGTGLGLSTVQRIVAAHRGTVRVESRVGQGSTFIFTLPKA